MRNIDTLPSVVCDGVHTIKTRDIDTLTSAVFDGVHTNQTQATDRLSNTDLNIIVDHFWASANKVSLLSVPADGCNGGLVGVIMFLLV
jgi:hypothetical protein